MKNIKLAIILSLLLFFPIISAELDKGITIEFKINNYGLYSTPFNLIPEDYHIVGRFFYYTINFTANEEISDDITIFVISPNNKTIHSEKTNLSLKKGESYTYIPKSKDNEGVLALPFDLAGDYKVEICSANRNRFYRQFPKIYTQNNGRVISIWEDICFHTYFDVMPHWQYKLYDENKKLI